MIIMHINYCEQGQSIEEACFKAVKWGYDGVEFRQITPETQSDPAQYYDRVAEAVQKSGLKHVVFGGPPTKIMADDPSIREDSVVQQETYFRLAAERFDISIWNARTPTVSVTTDSGERITGSHVATQAQWEAVVEAYKHLGDVAQELGFKLAFETHHGNLTDLPDVTRKLVDDIDHPAVGINLDYGNMLFTPGAPSLEEAIDIAGDRLFYIHLKNGVKVGERTIQVNLSDGEINNRQFLKMAQKLGYSGPICLEAPRRGDREWFAQVDLAYVRHLIDDLEFYG